MNLNKRLYILLDAKREAETHDLNFGKIVDPVGAGVERTFAVYDEILHRRKIQRQREFLLAFAECVWGEGVGFTMGGVQNKQLIGLLTAWGGGE